MSITVKCARACYMGCARPIDLWRMRSLRFCNVPDRETCPPNVRLVLSPYPPNTGGPGPAPSTLDSHTRLPATTDYSLACSYDGCGSQSPNNVSYTMLTWLCVSRALIFIVSSNKGSVL